MVEERQGELPGRHGGPDPLQRKPRLGARAGEPDAPHVTWGERPLAGTWHEDAELDQPLDVLWEDAGPTGQLKGGELIHANHVRYRFRNDASQPMVAFLAHTSRCRELLTVTSGNAAGRPRSSCTAPLLRHSAVLALGPVGAPSDEPTAHPPSSLMPCVSRASTP
jgi:hypothetical protein